MAQPDFVIAGAGIIGLSLALELHQRGASVVVLEAGQALRQTSSAAAGMLAVEDPANPAALKPLAQLSVALYPAWLDRLAELANTRVPFQTTTTLEALESAAGTTHTLHNPQALVPQLATDAPAFRLLEERSVDPRQLAHALLAAVHNTSGPRAIELREHTALTRVSLTPTAVHIGTTAHPLAASRLIDCMGAWSPAPVAPRKGQMLAVRMPPSLDLSTVVRTPHVYIVPRTDGPDAGRAIIGATIEDVGFDLTVHPAAILTLNQRAIALIPALAQATFLESWSGLRPMTPDGLPLLGALPRATPLRPRQRSLSQRHPARSRHRPRHRATPLRRAPRPRPHPLQPHPLPLTRTMSKSCESTRPALTARLRPGV